MESLRRFKHYKTATCYVRSLKVSLLVLAGTDLPQALQEAIAARLKLLPSDIVSMSHVKEASHALVHLEEDWQVVALKEEEPKIAIIIKEQTM